MSSNELICMFLHARRERVLGGIGGAMPIAHEHMHHDALPMWRAVALHAS